MVDLYATIIRAKRRKFETVPANLQEAVRERLLELGYDTNGDPIPTMGV